MTVSGWIDGGTVLVTGATGGIGKATAAGLAGLGARVGITGRDRVRADAAAADIRACGGPGVDVFVADMSSQDEVRRLAVEVLDAYPRLDVLVNNVGGSWAQERRQGRRVRWVTGPLRSRHGAARDVDAHCRCSVVGGGTC